MEAALVHLTRIDRWRRQYEAIVYHGPPPKPARSSDRPPPSGPGGLLVH
ncbi:hypothetical protein [Sphingopyxis terrae]